MNNIISLIDNIDQHFISTIHTCIPEHTHSILIKPSNYLKKYLKI